MAYLIRTHRQIHSRGDAGELRRAYQVAERMHAGQFRKSGEPYITHPLAVAQILAELGMDTTTLVAALLHDTVEDTSYTMNELRADFGGEVALLVDGVTKFEKAFYGDDAEVHTIRKMIVAAGADVRVLIVKLADRLHNMRTIDVRSVASRVRIARATQDVLIPLCERLGIQVLKRDLEDSVLAAVEPDAYDRLQAWVAHRPEWTAYTDAVIAQVGTTIKAAKIKARVVARPHHLHTIWAETIGGDAPEPYELPRVAILVDGPENDCYAALGAIHAAWRPVAARFKDFIAAPKNNLYRSLHTTVIGPEARAIEVQIRTEEMDRDAVYGIVASFRFARRRGTHRATPRAARAVPGLAVTSRTLAPSLGRNRSTAPSLGRNRSTAPSSGRNRSTVGRPDQLAWLRNLVQWQEQAVDPLRFIESLRCDLTEDQVHVFVAGVSEGPSPLAAKDPSGRRDSASGLIQGGALESAAERRDNASGLVAATQERTERHTAAGGWAGQRLVLPAGATPVDVAYALDPDLGDRCIAATVNGHLVILSVPLSDGDVVEIHTQDAESPSADWLSFVRTPRAQLHIEKSLGLRDQPEKAPPLPLRDRALIGLNAIRMELHWRERRLANESLLLAVTSGLGYPDPQALCVAVADRVVTAARVADLLIEEAEGAAVLAADAEPAAGVPAADLEPAVGVLATGAEPTVGVVAATPRGVGAATDIAALAAGAAGAPATP